MAARFDNKTLWLVQKVWWEFDEECAQGERITHHPVYRLS
jgi:hypothetical protein